MNFNNLFGQENQQTDPYWEFDETKHFKPKLNKGDFFKLTGFDFGWFVLEPISIFIKDKKNEIERGKCLSYGQKALYYWWYVDAQVTNGGFVQFYYNGCEPYVPTIIKSLEYIGDKEMASLIQRAEAIYQKNKWLINKARKTDLFGSDLYEKLEELGKLDKEYYETNKKTMSNIENYIRKNPNEICLDEEGSEYEMEYSGAYKTYYPDNRIKELFSLLNGVMDGEFKSYYENGQIKEQIQYEGGIRTGEQMEWFENGKMKYRVTKAGSQFEHFWYYENGEPQKLEHHQISKDERIGEYKEWYDNGQLAKAGTYISKYERSGEWLEFYKDGRKKLEGEFKNGKFLMHHCWNEKRVQTLKNGTGLYIHFNSESGGCLDYHEQVFKDYKRHGQQTAFKNGIMSFYQEMEDGKENGYTRTFYKNGKIKEETLYEDGQVISKKSFLKSETPKGIVTFQYLMKDQWLWDEDLPTADTYPICINEDEIKQKVNFPKTVLEDQDQDVEGLTCVWLTVNEFGEVTKVQFKSAYMMKSEDFLKVAEKMKFKPAVKDGKDVASFIYIIARFTIE